MSGGPTTPPGQHPPFAVVTDHDHRAWIIIAAAIGLSFILTSFAARVIIRKSFNTGWGWDDGVIVIATIFATIQSSLVLVASSNGLGRSISLIPSGLRGRVQQLYYVSNIFFLLASDAGRLSTLCFLHRLMAPDTRVYRFCNTVICILPVFTFAFVVATALTCNLSHPWLLVNEQCPSWWTRWQIQAAFSMAFEIVIFCTPIWLMWDLQKPRDFKAEVIACFVPRILTIVFTALRLAEFDPSALTTDPTLRESVYICWTQAEMDYSIMAATIPTARRFILNFITYYHVPLNTSGWRSDTLAMSSLVPRDQGVVRTNCEYSGEHSGNTARRENCIDIDAERDRRRIFIDTSTTFEYGERDDKSEKSEKSVK